MTDSSKIRIGIIGAGFSGISVAANLHRLNKSPFHFTVFDKSKAFGEGDAYRTSFPFHLLNVRARDMSAFEDNPSHFVEWVKNNADSHTWTSQDKPASEQFLPRFIYRKYLKSIIDDISSCPVRSSSLNLVADEIIDIQPANNEYKLISSSGNTTIVDQVVLALGNSPPPDFPFPVSTDISRIDSAWDYDAINKIKPNDPVVIIGTGLSMVDAALSLFHQQHRGPVTAISRHGLLPLPHSDTSVKYTVSKDGSPKSLLNLMKNIRSQCNIVMSKNGDWRSIINSLRDHLPAIWKEISTQDKKRFLRHVLPYWNIHRHRINNSVLDLLLKLQGQGQFSILAGRVTDISDGQTKIKLRHSNQTKKITTRWVINCMGSAMSIGEAHSELLGVLSKKGLAMPDTLNLGLSVTDTCKVRTTNGSILPNVYALGPLVRGTFWECTAVPDIRKQSLTIARSISKSIEENKEVA